MAGGHKVDPGKLGAAGKAYAEEGTDLGEAGQKIEAGVGEGQIGNLWSQMAKSYGDAIKQYQTAVEKYGEQVGGLGDSLSKAAKSYEDGEAVSAESIAKKGV